MPTRQKIASLRGRHIRRNSHAAWFWAGPHSKPSNRRANDNTVAEKNSRRSEANRYRLRILPATGRCVSGAIPVEYLRPGYQSQGNGKAEVMPSKVKEAPYKANLAPVDGSPSQGLGEAMDVSD